MLFFAPRTKKFPEGARCFSAHERPCYFPRQVLKNSLRGRAVFRPMEGHLFCIFLFFFSVFARELSSTYTVFVLLSVCSRHRHFTTLQLLPLLTRHLQIKKSSILFRPLCLLHKPASIVLFHLFALSLLCCFIFILCLLFRPSFFSQLSVAASSICTPALASPPFFNSTHGRLICTKAAGTFKFSFRPAP